jgi:hypothetical protein
MRKIIIASVFCLLFAGFARAGENYLITSNSVGKVRLGMTVAQARKALQGYTLKRAEDGDGLALILVGKGKKTIMWFYAGEEDTKKPINEKGIIEYIFVWDAGFKTEDGIYPDMLVRDAEKILGKVNEVFMSEIESREYAVFTKKPKGLGFRVGVHSEGKYPTAGIYEGNSRDATRYTPEAFIVGIEVSESWD